MKRLKGRDLRVGDVLPVGQGGRFLILGFAEWAPGKRLALNCWNEGFVVTDDRPRLVVTP